MRPHEPILSLFISWYSTFVHSCVSCVSRVCVCVFFFVWASEAWYSHCFYDIRPNIYWSIGLYWTWTYQFCFQSARAQAWRRQRKTIRPLLTCIYFQFAQSLNVIVRKWKGPPTADTYIRFDYYISQRQLIQSHLARRRKNAESSSNGFLRFQTNTLQTVQFLCGCLSLSHSPKVI